MRISDWSSDVCSSDLTSRRSVSVTPGSSALCATRRGWLWPRNGETACGETASGILAHSLWIEEVGGHHLDLNVDVLQRVGGDQPLSDAVRPVLQQPEGDVLLQHRAVGGRGDVAEALRQAGRATIGHQMRAGADALAGDEAAPLQAPGIHEALALVHGLADEGLLRRTHAPEAKIYRSGAPVPLRPRPVALLAQLR